MKKEYVMPVMEMVLLQSKDIITISGDETDIMPVNSNGTFPNL